MSSLRVRAASVVAVLGLLVVGATAATAGPANAPGPSNPSAQPPLSKESAGQAAKALSQGAGTQLIPSAVMAAVAADGGLCPGQSFGVATVNKISGFAGSYEVIFNQVISGGTYTATIGLCGNSGTPTPGFVTVVGRVGTDNGVYVTTRNTAGVLTDLGFHLHVLY